MVVGSGNPVTPWARMHSEVRTICSFCCALTPRGGPLPGSSLWHCACAALNAGENGLMFEPWAMLMPPPALGSGKLGTPCERMHSENAKKRVPPPPEWFDLLPDVPQAVIASAHPMIAAANHRRRRGNDGWIASTVSLLADRA